MSIDIVKANIKEKKFAPCYFFYGQEAYLRNHYVNEIIKKAVQDEFLDFNLNILEGKDFSVMRFESAVLSYPCFDERKIVLVKNLVSPQLNEETVQSIGEIVRDGPDTTVTIFEFDETISIDRKYTSLKKAVTDSRGVVCEFKTPKEADLIAWVKRHFAARRKSIETADVRYILSVCENSMTNLLNEIEKICENTTADKVTQRQIDRVVVKSLDAKVFDLTDALTAADYGAAYLLLDELIRLKEDPVRIMGAVSNHFLKLYKVKNCINAGMDARKAGLAAGIGNEYVLNKILKKIKDIDEEYLGYALACCGKCDFDLKNSRTDDRLLLEMLFGKLENYGYER